MTDVVTLKSGRRVSRSARALAALRNAETRASAHVLDDNDAKAAYCLLCGMHTAMSWLDGTHHKIAR